jgi:archaellum component FlaC
MKRAFLIWGLITIVAEPALAGNEEDRVREVEDNLGRMKDNLYGIASKSGAGDIEEAIRNAYRVKEAADKLRSLNPANEPGKTMASYYANWVDKFQDAARALKDMKEAQLKQENEKLWDRCTEADKNLRSLVQSYLDKKNTPEGRKGVAAIVAEAEKSGRSFSENLQQAENQHSQVGSARSQTRNFSENHLKWSDVKDKLYSGSDEIWSKWTERMQLTRQACQSLARGKDSVLVSDAIAKLSSNTKDIDDRYRELRKRYVEWRKDLNSFRQGALADAREIKELLCAALDWQSRVEQITNKHASELKSKWERLTNERDRMLDTSDQLISAGAISGHKVKKLIRDAWDKVERVKDGELLGANNPKVRAQIEKGKYEHIRYQASSCDMKEVFISSSYCSNPHPDRSDCRVDCVRGCKVIEIKPNNAAELNIGKQQVAAYEAAFQKLFKVDGQNAGKQSAMFTMESGRYKWLERCVSGSPGSYSLDLTTEIQQYEFCPPDAAIFFGALQEIPTEDPPDSATE